MPADGAIERPDGRAVAWATWGGPGGRPLLVLHGTPGSRLARSSDPELYERIGAYVATFDRPGYGRSSGQAGRTVASAADDALAVADALGWERFAVLGVSGGGPHALALAHRAPERIRSLGLAVGSVPTELVDPADLIELNREAIRRAVEEGRAGLEDFLAEPAARLAADPGAAIDAVMADAPAADQEMLRRPALRAVVLESLREAFANGPQGWFDDSWALVTHWGFDLREISVPVRMWCGELDRNVPASAVQRMAAQLDVESLEILPGAGHFGWIAEEERILRQLLD